VDAALLERIRTIHKFSRGTYGMPRIFEEFKAEGTRVGRKRIARLMRTDGLQGVSRRRSTRTSISLGLTPGCNMWRGSLSPCRAMRFAISRFPVPDSPMTSVGSFEEAVSCPCLEPTSLRGAEHRSDRRLHKESAGPERAGGDW
jgi:hypothetical protein